MVEHARSGGFNAVIAHLLSRFTLVLFSDLDTAGQSVHTAHTPDRSGATGAPETH